MLISPIRNNQLSTINQNNLQIKNKISFPQKENISKDTFSFKGHYVSAKSLRDAEAYAKNKLNIRNYNVSNLDVANYLNKGLSYLNSVTNGKIGALDGVVYTSFAKFNKSLGVIAFIKSERQYGLMDIFNLTKPRLNHTLYINRDFFNNVDFFIKNMKIGLLQTSLLKNDKNGLKLNDNFTTKDQQKYEKLMNTRLKYLSLEEKVDLSSYLFTLQDYAMFKQSIVDTSIKKILKDKNKLKSIGNIVQSFSNRLNKNDKFRLLTKMEKKLGIQHPIQIDGKYKILNHEIGHMLHAENDPATYFNPSQYQEAYFRRNIYQVSRVSDYATKNFNEFVAETFAKLVQGIKMPYEIMKLYYQFGGPKVN